MSVSIQTYIEFAFHDMKLRPTASEVLSAYSETLARMIQAQEFQIKCHEDGSYGPTDQAKIDLIKKDIEFLQEQFEVSLRFGERDR